MNYKTKLDKISAKEALELKKINFPVFTIDSNELKKININTFPILFVYQKGTLKFVTHIEDKVVSFIFQQIKSGEVRDIQ